MVAAVGQTLGEAFKKDGPEPFKPYQPDRSKTEALLRDDLESADSEITSINEETYTMPEHLKGDGTVVTVPDSSGDSGSGNTSGTGTTPTKKGTYSGSDDLTPKNAFLYLTEVEGLSPSKAKGIVANIERESSFRPAVPGDNGTSVGLLQWHAERKDGMIAAVPDYATNWKGQLSYALREKDAISGGGAAYRAFDDGGDPQKAANWWLRKWERSAHPDRDEGKNNTFLQGYNF